MRSANEDGASSSCGNADEGQGAEHQIHLGTDWKRTSGSETLRTHGEAASSCGSSNEASSSCRQANWSSSWSIWPGYFLLRLLFNHYDPSFRILGCLRNMVNRPFLDSNQTFPRGEARWPGTLRMTEADRCIENCIDALETCCCSDLHSLDGLQWNSLAPRNVQIPWSTVSFLLFLMAKVL